VRTYSTISMPYLSLSFCFTMQARKRVPFVSTKFMWLRFGTVSWVIRIM
jgi:hypothetical protein